MKKPRLLLSIDLEDWHQLVHRRLGLPDWDKRHSEFESQVARLLSLLEEIDAKATFFLLGMTVANYPDIVREIVARGHEPASHGFAHGSVYEQTREEFHADVERSLETIESVVGSRPRAYRAPAFSITSATPWAYEVLADAGFRCDSSQYDSPRRSDRISGIPHEPYRLRLESGQELWELPVAMWGPLPIGGASYWRLLPTPVLRAGLREDDVLYFHPYEFSPTPLKAALPRRATARQRFTAASRSAWRNSGRPLVATRLRRIARTHMLVSYDQAYDDIARRYGTRTRTLSQEGVLV